MIAARCCTYVRVLQGVSQKANPYESSTLRKWPQLCQNSTDYQNSFNAGKKYKICNKSLLGVLQAEEYDAYRLCVLHVASHKLSTNSTIVDDLQ